MPTAKARLDADGTAKGKTRIVCHPKVGDCFGSGMTLIDPQYETEQGERITLIPSGNEPIDTDLSDEGDW